MELQSSTKSSTDFIFDAEKGQDGAKTESEWKKRIEKFTANSSFSASLYQFKTKSWIKSTIWALVVLAAIAGFCIVTALSIRMLIEEPIATSITVSRQDSLEFPAVTVCSLSFLNTTRLRELSAIFGINIAYGLEKLFDNARATPPNITGCHSLADEFVLRTQAEIGFGGLITSYARNDPNKLVSECVFLGENCTSSLTEVDTISGVCLTFNGPDSQPARRVSGTGPRQGLRLELFNGEQLFSLGSNYGYSIVVHNRDEPARPESEGVVVGLNANVHVGMREVISNDKTRFHSGVACTRAVDNRDSKLSFNDYSSYSPSLCLNECFYRFLADSCGCVERELYSPVSSPYTEMRPCNPRDLCCESRLFEQFKEEACGCPPKCETVERTLTVSSATHDRDGRVGINVYYETLLLEARQTTDSYTPWSLISDIGGNSGLFLGFTLLTAAEVVMLVGGLLSDCCFPFCRKKRKAKN